MKVGIVLREDLVEKGEFNKLVDSLIGHVSEFIKVGIHTFIVILPEKKRYQIVDKILRRFSTYNLEITFREMYGDDWGGGIISLIPFVHHGEKILIIDPVYRYSPYLYEYFMEASDREEHSMIFISRDEIPPYISLSRDRVIHLSNAKDRRTKYSYVGTAILNYNFFSKISELISIYPDLHTTDISRIFNLFLSKGGILRADYLSPSEWSIGVLLRE